MIQPSSTFSGLGADKMGHTPKKSAGGGGGLLEREEVLFKGRLNSLFSCDVIIFQN